MKQMGVPGKYRVGMVMALAVAAAAVSTARADWVASGGGMERTGFTKDAVLPPVSVAWKYAVNAENTYNVNPVIVGKMVYWVSTTTEFLPKPSWWPTTVDYPPKLGEDKPSWYPTDQDWPPSETSGALVACSADTAAPTWRFRATDGVHYYRIRSSPSYANGTIYFGADNGVFYALDAQTGEMKWYLQTDRAVRAAPAVVGGVVYFANNARKVYAVDAASGEVKWTFDTGDNVYAAIAATGDTVWVACTDNTLYGLDARRGLERWRIPFVGAGGLYSAPAVEGRSAYLAVKDRVYKVAASGAASPLGEVLPARITAAPAAGRRYLYVGCQNGTLYALDLAHGRLAWSHKFTGPVQAQPLVCGNLVVAGATRGQVAALDGDTGAVRWVYGEHAPWAPERKVGYQLMAAAASGGDLYLSWDDGNLARFTADALDITPPEISDRTPEAGSPAGPVSPSGEITVEATVYDEGSGVLPEAVSMTLDGAPVELSHRGDGNSYYYTLSGTTAKPALEDGWHTVVLAAQDQRGNKITDTWTFLVYGEAATETGPQTTGEVGHTERF